VLVVSTAEKDAEATQALLKQLQLTSPQRGDMLLAIYTAPGVKSETTTLKTLAPTGAVQAGALQALLERFAPAPLDAQQLLDAALAQAQREGKRVFVQESATWCGPCWQLARFWDAQKDLLSKDYIAVKLDHRWTHTQEIVKKYRPSDSAGVPWVCILDADGKLLITSDGPDGNAGFPSRDNSEEIAHFMAMLRTTRVRLTDADLATIQAALLQ
jgi:hypothetical protein